MRRIILLAFVAMALAPGTWLRSPPPVYEYGDKVSIFQLRNLPPISGKLKLVAAWHLASSNDHFGGYSALEWLGGDRLLAGSDQARLMTFTIPGKQGPEPDLRFVPGQKEYDRTLVDLEALTRDPATDTLWAAYENRNLIERLQNGGETIDQVKPLSMREWSPNGGPESLLRLKDGRFLVIAESPESWTSDLHNAVLFEGDPVDIPQEVRFALQVDSKYKPVDAAQLPDGRVLILLRHFVLGLPPSFTSALMVIDPAGIESRGIVSGPIIARIDDPDIAENYEGLAVVPGNGGVTDLYLISDDNFASFQRTLLLKLQWKDGRQAQIAPDE